MSRPLAAATVLALALALTLVPGFAASGSGSRAAAADCAWQRHSKRVVKQVRRPGRARRLVRTRHWWSCEPLASQPAAAPPTPLAAPTPLPAAEPERPAVARLGVKADEYSFTLSRPTLTAGEAIIELNNQGEDAHNLNLQLEGGEEAPSEIPEAASLERRTGRFTLPAGTYRLWCSLPEHDEKGMHATLVVGDG